MKLFRDASIAFVLFVLLFILSVAPAAAAVDDYQLSYTWTSGKSSEAQIESFQPTNTSTLTYAITANHANSQIYFIANVTDDGGEPKPGFNITDYPKTDLVSGSTTIAEISNTVYDRNTGTLIIPLTNAAQLFSIDLVIESDNTAVYHDETNTIKAGLYVFDGEDYVPISNTAVAKANNRYPSMGSYGTFSLDNPSLMPSGASVIDLKYVYNNAPTTNGFTAIFSTLTGKGTRVRFTEFALNFSDVKITADGETKSYSEWMESGNSPVIFTNAASDGYVTGVTSDGLSVTFTPDGAEGYFRWNETFNLSITTTEDFKYSGDVAPIIDLSTLKLVADMKINNRGGNVQFTSLESAAANTGTDLFPYYTRTVLTGAPPNTVTAQLMKTSGTGHVISNSESYDVSHPFYYQELFKALFRNSVRDGTDETLTFGIPEGVSVTHLRIPKNGTEVARYESIAILKDGETYTLNPNNNAILLSGLVSDETSSPFTPYSPGEDVVLQIDGLLLFERNVGGDFVYSGLYTITFIGTTNVNAGNLQFTVSDGDNMLAGLTMGASPNYVVSPYLTNTAGHLTNSDTGYNALPNLVRRGDTFYMYNTFNASSYPYGSAIRLNPMTTTGLYSNPILYFSVPGGLETGDVQITYANGTDRIAAGEMKDIDGRLLTLTQKTIPNAGLYASSGGKLIEAKIHLAENGKENDLFWIGTSPRYYARLPVTVSQEYTGSSFDFGTNSVLLSSWDPNAHSSSTNGAGGASYNISADPNFSQALAVSNINGTYPNGMMPARVSVRSEQTVISSVGVRIDSDYIYYNPNSEDTYPSLKAGSQNEMFKIYFYNGLGETVGGSGGLGTDPATIYFVLPTHEGDWRAALMDIEALDDKMTVAGLMDEPMIYYSTDDFGAGVGSLTLADMGTSSWTAITDITDTTDVDWSAVTAIKCEIYEAEDMSRFELLLPFGLPQVGNTVEFEETAIGQTLYDVYVNGESVLSGENSYTAAVFLTESDGPEVQTLTIIPQGMAVEYMTGTIPEWYNVIIKDDFTEKVNISSVSIVYTDVNGINTPIPVTVGELFTRTDLPASEGYVVGSRYALNPLAVNPVTNERVGSYTITYTTDADDDSKTGEMVLRFRVTKAASTISLNTPAGREIFMNDEIPSPSVSWQEHFRQFVSGTDTGVSIPNSAFVYNVSSNLNPAVPGIYSMIYDYTDLGLNTKSATAQVTVKYADEVVVNAIAAESPVMDLTVLIQSDGAAAASAAYDGDKSGYAASVKAVKATPTTVDYTITYSGIPAGLIDSGSGSMTGTAVYDSSSSPIVRDLELMPAKFIVNLDNASGIKNVNLYEVANSGDLCIETIELVGDETEITFETQSGWFGGEEYYLTAELFRGYASSSADDFDSESTPVYVKAEGLVFNHADIELDLFAQDSPLISGFVWNDENGDSLMDDTEVGISAAEVDLLDGTLGFIRSTFTAADGSYDFIGLDENEVYYIQINLPDGFNRASAFNGGAGDQKIDAGNDYSSEMIAFDTEFHHTDVNAGFYVHMGSGTDNGGSGGGGSGFGNATVVESTGPSTPMSGLEENRPGNGTGAGNGGTDNMSGYEESGEVVRESWSWWWLWLLLLLLLIVAYYCYRKYKKNRENK